MVGGGGGLVAFLGLSLWCLLIVVWLFLTVPWVSLQFVIVVFPDHTHLLTIFSGDSVQFQRVQALTRSQTQIDMKQQHHISSTSLNSLNEDMQGVKRDLGLASPRKGDR